MVTRVDTAAEWPELLLCLALTAPGCGMTPSYHPRLQSLSFSTPCQGGWSWNPSNQLPRPYSSQANPLRSKRYVVTRGVHSIHTMLSFCPTVRPSWG